MCIVFIVCCLVFPYGLPYIRIESKWEEDYLFPVLSSDTPESNDTSLCICFRLFKSLDLNL